MSWRGGCSVLGGLFVLAGVLLPRGWYDEVPKFSALPAHAWKGITLFQVSLVLEGLALVSLSLTRWRFTRIGPTERLAVPATPDESGTDRSHGPFWPLAAVTALGLGLRLLRLDSDLWLDEIAPILTYRDMSTLQVLSSFVSSNNHLLNTLLVKAAMLRFGEEEWAVRLPAVMFGAATIPALYWVARLAMPRRASLGAALLLAVSYHHVFFSQNARGYSAYLLFSLLSSALLVKALQHDQAGSWILYVVTMILNFASLLNSGFVFAAHLLVGAGAVVAVRHRGASAQPLSRRLGIVFAITGFLAFQLYALALPQVYVYARTVHTDPAAGYAPFSGEFVQELIRGVTAGFGTGLVLGALPFVGIAAFGSLVLFRRHWALTSALAIPEILTAVFLIANRLIFSPRFFLLALPLAVISVVRGAYSFAEFLGKRLGSARAIFWTRLAIAFVLVVCAGSLASLRPYYAVPKQNYRASIRYVESQRRPGEIVIVVHLAESGYRYYGRRFGLSESRDYFFVRSVAALDAVLASHAETRSFLVTTFPRALRLTYPDLEARIRSGWAVARTFPGAIGDGDISVWKYKPP